MMWYNPDGSEGQVMTETVPISQAARSTILQLAARTGRRPTELLDAAVRAYAAQPVMEIPGVDPKDVWEAAAEAESGLLTPAEDVFAKLRARG